MLKGAVIAACLVLMPCSADAGPYEDAVDAAQRGDYQRASRIWRSLAEQGDSYAQFKIGSWHHTGQFGVRKDLAEALKWYRKAAEQGNVSAQSKLAQMYDFGKDVPQDHFEAAKWYRKAAEQGSDLEQYNLGVMLYRGEGVPKDYVRSYMWLNIVSGSNVTTRPQIRTREWALQLRDDVEKLMTREQVAEAQRLSREWMKKHPR